jgi:uncharacterized membrane protein YdbT with pleckstrin-like domain
MFCPRCGSGQSEEVRFCKACGANLFAVRTALDNRESSQTSDWDKARAAEMSMAGGEAERRQLETDHHRGIAAATRRFQEIKAGVITSSAGLGVGIFLAVFMQAIVQSGRVSAAAAEIISRLWVVGVIPLMVGIALIVNGYFVSRKIVELFQHTEKPEPNNPSDTNPHLLRGGETTQFAAPGSSVTEGTTKHLNIAR